MKFKVSTSRVLITFASFFAVFFGSLPSGTDGLKCKLPNNAGESICLHFRKCPSLDGLQRGSFRGLRSEDASYMESLKCKMQRLPLFCCPDYAVAPTTTTEIIDIPLVPSRLSLNQYPALPEPPDVKQIELHKNFGLINKKCGKVSQDRIVGGNVTKVGEFPWMALLQYEIEGKRSFKCGGTLISKYYVLTAAHCLNDDLVAVRLGEHNTLSVEDSVEGSSTVFTAQDIDVERYFVYPKYNKTVKQNDIGLIRLKSAANFEKKNIRTICLPVEEESQFDNVDADTKEHLTIAGWGVTKRRDMSNVLMKAEVSFIDMENCKKKFEAATEIEVFKTWLCAGRDIKVDTCYGDSGGPLFAPAEVNFRVKMYQYGVISAGVACEDPNEIYPGVYTNVGYYIKWILDHMHEDSR